MQKSISSFLLLLSSMMAIAQANIGITVQDGKLFPQITSISPGSPAERAGIPLNGVIMRINGEDAFLMKAKDAKKRLDGPAGEPIQLIVTGIYRTDTFKLTRVTKKKPSPSTQNEKLLAFLGRTTIQLQAAPEKLIGKYLSEGKWLTKKPFPDAVACYYENDTTKAGMAEPIFRTILFRTVDKDKLSELEFAFSTYFELLNGFLSGWKHSIQKESSFQVGFDNHTWKIGNTIISLYYNPNNQDQTNKVYSLELKIVSVR